MVHLKNFKLLFILFITAIILCISCTNSGKDFENKIINRYEKHEEIINLKSIFDFKWDKLYVLTPYHYPDATDSQTISNIIGTNYDKDRNQFERVLIFLYKNKVIKSISTKYQKENYIDYKPLKVDFYFDQNDPAFFTPQTCNFILKKEESNYSLSWVN